MKRSTKHAVWYCIWLTALSVLLFNFVFIHTLSGLVIRLGETVQHPSLCDICAEGFDVSALTFLGLMMNYPVNLFAIALGVLMAGSYGLMQAHKRRWKSEYIFDYMGIRRVGSWRSTRR